MMSNFDTTDYVRKLELAGLPQQQTEVHAQALAKMMDKAKQEAQLLTLQYNLQTASHESEARLMSHVTNARKVLSAEIALQNAKIDALKSFLDVRMDQRGLISRDLSYLYMGVLIGVTLAMLTKIIFFSHAVRSILMQSSSTAQAMSLHILLNRIPRTGDCCHDN
ncbi:hypothetical protein PO883_27760 [Massilia sp. DJPM01]|uniref:hypothetical protein n=1 Tax=Massilia sp. DJPM01 TaxID=3024404 RepID=UPI00259E4A14|nr:hypothetical protein [Massilia sp. DJPM01]MDM5180983.1 hypothetical protein [Massilia sp. DJPM01]